MRKKQDIMWEQSTLWESVEKWVTKYLKDQQFCVLMLVGGEYQFLFDPGKVFLHYNQLWISMVDHVVVHSKDDIRVVYRDGIEKQKMDDENASLRLRVDWFSSQ